MDLRDEEIYSPDVLSTILDVSTKTLEKWRNIKAGPPYSRLPNGRIRYKGMDVIEWLEKLKPQEHDAG
jgi:hypothetical protein